MPGLGAILTAIATPFDEDLNVDEEAFVALLEYVCSHGSDGVVVCGTTGEAATLADDEHLRVIELAIRHVPEGKTVIAGTGSNDTRHAVSLTERATELGVDATLSVTPYYNRPNRRGIVAHYSEISKATDKPIVLYNIPARTGTDMPNDLISDLAQLDHVEYVKQANDDSLELVDGLEVYAGNDDTLVRTLEMGGAGGICVASHIVGERMQQMVGADSDERMRIDRSLRPLYRALGVTTNPIPLKAALNMLGHDVGGLRLPLVEASDGECDVIRAALERCGLLGART